MDREKLQLFAHDAKDELATVRSHLLLAQHSGDTSGLAPTRRRLDRLISTAEANEQFEFAALANLCIIEIDRPNWSTTRGGSVLDIVARMEAQLWALPTVAGDFDFDVGGFVDASFDNILLKVRETPSTGTTEEFEVDEETLEIFRAEADEVLKNIGGSLRALALSPEDQTALWEIRRNAHTFKGSAGIVGLTGACRIAHQMEDLLDEMVENHRPAPPAVINFLERSAASLASIVAVKADENEACLKASYENALRILSSGSLAENQHLMTETLDTSPDQAVRRANATRSAAPPIVRVSLDRLDEIIKLSQALKENQALLARGLTDPAAATALSRSLLETGQSLTDEIQTRLRMIRMVKFMTVETRLARAVNVTCADEGKKASLTIENGDLEIDTLLMDALIEPLLHLLKNAVVHGIETPETRRLTGKPDRGDIRVRLEASSEDLSLYLSDDGGGIQIAKLTAEAVAKGLITSEMAASMSDADALRLVFDRGLTTADRIDLNAGRGVGMSIVKESVESRGGTIEVESAPQRGTTFKISIPLDPSVRTPGEAAPLQEGTGPPLVMVVDDSSSVRHRTATMVKQAGFRAITAENGAEALELLLSSKWEPDIILSDVEMPHVDGWALLEYLKTDEHFGHIPVVMITSLEGDEHRQRAFDLGASDFLVKPIIPSNLKPVLEIIGQPVDA